MRHLLPLCLFCLALATAQAQTTQHLWLLGNTADIPVDSPYWILLREKLEQADKPVYLLIAGDIVPGCDG
ncbi:MAG: hypothetical protein KDD28_33610, partial [Phaeodactylibacter sp.]|nr:hypothetical protein [Phaeodactylibacter sp.]